VKTKEQMIEQILYARKKHPKKYELAHHKVQEEYDKFGKLVDEELAKGNFMTLNTLLGYIESDF
jgi:hypothetical protein